MGLAVTLLGMAKGIPKLTFPWSEVVVVVHLGPARTCPVGYRALRRTILYPGVNVSVAVSNTGELKTRHSFTGRCYATVGS